MKVFFILVALFSFTYSMELLAYYNKGCGCCESYFSKLEKEGFRIRRVEVSGERLMEIKSQLGIPPNLRSCHTMVYKDKFVEGHVPPKGIREVIRSKEFKGVASLHGKKSALGGYEDSYELIKRR